MNSPSETLAPVFAFLERSLTTAQTTFDKLPGSAVIQRYVRSSHQNDPGRTILELILVIFAIRTLLQSRTKSDRNGKHFITFSDKEIEELVEEWTPEPLAPPLSATQQADLDAVPIIAGPTGPKPKLVSNGKTATNLASLNFTGLAGNEHIKQQAAEILRKYGLGSCGPPGFYGTLDVHMKLESDIADFLGTEAAILYSQGFSTTSSVIPAFCKRGDIIVADRAVNFSIQKGIQISRSTVRWFDHNDPASLEEVLISVEKERKKRRGPLTRRFIITEGIFQRDGSMVDLPKIIELKYKYKYRLILDESHSFGVVGRTGRGLTELYNVPASKVDMLLGSCSIGLGAAGGFCAGSLNVIDHQRINGPSFVFSASMPALLAVSASEAINIFRSSPSVFEALQENVRAARAILDRVDCISTSASGYASTSTTTTPAAEPKRGGTGASKMQGKRFGQVEGTAEWEHECVKRVERMIATSTSSSCGGDQDGDQDGDEDGGEVRSIASEVLRHGFADATQFQLSVSAMNRTAPEGRWRLRRCAFLYRTQIWRT